VSVAWVGVGSEDGAGAGAGGEVGGVSGEGGGWGSDGGDLDAINISEEYCWGHIESLAELLDMTLVDVALAV
jgi:hypothetical protein